MVIAGAITDRYSRTVLLFAIFFGRALCYLLLLIIEDGDTVGLFTFAALFGFVDYSVVPPVVSLVGAHAGKDCVGLGVGILLAWHSLGGAVGSMLGGMLFNEEAGYTSALWCCSVLCFIAAGACITIRPEPLIRKSDDKVASINDPGAFLDQITCAGQLARKGASRQSATAQRVFPNFPRASIRSRAIIDTTPRPNHKKGHAN